MGRPRPKIHEKQGPVVWVLEHRNGSKINSKSDSFWGRFWDSFQDHFGRVLGFLWGFILAQDAPKRSQEAPGRALWSSKKPKRHVLKKCDFPMKKQYFLASEAFKMPWKSAGSLPKTTKTLQDPPKKWINKWDPFCHVLDYFLDTFGTHFGVKISCRGTPKMGSRLEPNSIGVEAGNGCRATSCAEAIANC
jgi:hypothetical protein